MIPQAAGPWAVAPAGGIAPVVSVCYPQALTSNAAAIAMTAHDLTNMAAYYNDDFGIYTATMSVPTAIFCMST
eukprot:EC714487.1.p3 GENE.EC714487.1~~EC714487.1.p3  ORF type:complete len:73 (+),score=10.79 EC714487.1:330-548(+)